MLVNEEISREILKHFELNENENKTSNLWDAVREYLKENKYTALKVYIRKEERSNVNNLSFYLRKIKKQNKATN